MTRKNLKKTAAVAAIVSMAAVMATGCGSKHSSATTADVSYMANNGVNFKSEGAAMAGAYADNYAESYDYGYEEAYEPAYAPEAEGYGQDMETLTGDSIRDSSGTGIIDPAGAQKRKLIRTVDLEVETQEYDKLKQNIEDQITALGGYIENEYSFNGSSFRNYEYDYGYGYGYNETRHSTMTVRIPDDKLDEFVTVMSGMSNVVSKSTSATDVTLQYTDIESKRDMYLAEQESLMALLEKAESIEDITYLTQRLTDVRYDIESMERQLRVYDNQVDYATVHLNVSEVEVLTPQTIVEKTPAEKIKEGFEASKQDVFNSLRDFGMNFVINSPYIIRTLIIIALIVGINFAIIRIMIAVIKKNVLKKRAKKEAAAKEAESKAAEAKEVKAEETKA